jgi:hypothetical protein
MCDVYKTVRKFSCIRAALPIECTLPKCGILALFHRDTYSEVVGLLLTTEPIVIGLSIMSLKATPVYFLISWHQ